MLKPPSISLISSDKLFSETLSLSKLSGTFAGSGAWSKDTVADCGFSLLEVLSSSLISEEWEASLWVFWLCWERSETAGFVLGGASSWLSSLSWVKEKVDRVLEKVSLCVS